MHCFCLDIGRKTHPSTAASRPHPTPPRRASCPSLQTRCRYTALSRSHYRSARRYWRQPWHAPRDAAPPCRTRDLTGQPRQGSGQWRMHLSCTQKGWWSRCLCHSIISTLSRHPERNVPRVEPDEVIRATTQPASRRRKSVAAGKRKIKRAVQHGNMAQLVRALSSQ